MNPDSLFFWILVTHMGDKEVIIALAAVAAIALLFLRKKREALVLALTLVGVQGAVQITKWALAVPRLTDGLIEATGYAFPSGHAATAPVIYGLAGIWLTRATGSRVWVVGGALIATLIAVSRVILGVHTPLQVIAGAALGWVAVWIASKKV